ncbi:MAG: glycosyltransferase family A protein [Chloroflexia bacterium]
MSTIATIEAITVAIPTYNRADLLPRAIDSALAAIAPGDEVLVVDDGSTDDTASVMARYGEPVHYLPVAHGGLAAARNAGLANAGSPLVAFLDSDDEYLPDKLSMQRAVLARHPDVVMALSDFGHRSWRGYERHNELARWTNDSRDWGAILGPGEPFLAYAPLPAGYEPFLVHVGDLYPPLVSQPYAAPLTTVVRRALLGDGPWFPPDLTFHCDWEGLARFARRGPVAYLATETAWNWSHRGPRLTDLDQGGFWSEYLTMAQRLWGADEAFLAQHGERYRAALARAYRRRARWLIKEGRTAEARADLRAAGEIAPVERLLATLPGRAIPVPLVRHLRFTWRRWRRGRALAPVPVGATR